MKPTRKSAGIVVAVITAALAIGGAGYLGGEHLSAQGPGGRFGGPGRAGGPGGNFMRGGRGPGGPGAMAILGPMMLNRLDLNDAQRDRVKEIVTSHRDEQQALADRARAAHESLSAAIIASPLDEATIRGKAADVAQVDADTAVAQGKVYNDVFQVLTSDQQKKLETLRADQRQRMEKRQQDRANRRQR